MEKYVVAKGKSTKRLSGKGRGKGPGLKKRRLEKRLTSLDKQRWVRKKHLTRLINIIAHRPVEFSGRDRALSREEKDARAAEYPPIHHMLSFDLIVTPPQSLLAPCCPRLQR